MALENDPALRIGNPPGWVVALTGFAQDSLVHDWRKYLEFIGKFFATRPEFRNWSAKKLVAYGFAAQAFKNRSRGNKKLARKCSMIAILNDFSLFRNRGLVKLLLL
jgi:hypothetical protein